MALRDSWIDKVNGRDFVDAEDINGIARAVIRIEEEGAGGSGEEGKSAYQFLSVSDMSEVEGFLTDEEYDLDRIYVLWAGEDNTPYAHKLDVGNITITLNNGDIWRFSVSDYSIVNSFLTGNTKGAQGESGKDAYPVYNVDSTSVLSGIQIELGSGDYSSDFGIAFVTRAFGSYNVGDVLLIRENSVSTLFNTKGADGRGISSVKRTSGTGAAGTTDTYTITYTDNTTSAFTVYNGKDGSSGVYIGKPEDKPADCNIVIDPDGGLEALGNIYYKIVDDGIYVNSHYSADNDISYYLCKKGPNSIFDFSTIGLVVAANPVSSVTTPTKYLVSASGDWHAPYVVRAVNNADGDNVSSNYFTGGNHSYTNSATGVATGRTANLKMYADGKVLSVGNSGYANNIKLEWDNYVQGYNTTKADGSGREILREHITMIFDGDKWDSETTIYPLEDISISTWYGLQFFTANYDYVAYIGGETGLISEKSADSESGNAETNAMKFFTLTDTAIVEIDTAYDLGKRKHASNTTKGFFARGSYSKAYGTVIGGTTSLVTAGAYSLRGSYTFKHEVQHTPIFEPVMPVESILKLNRTESNSNASYTAGNADTWYINPAKSNAVTVSGTPCVVADLTENSITVTENGTGSTGCAFPILCANYFGKSLTFNWESNGGSNTRISLMGFGNSNAKYITLDKTGSKTSAVIEISEDGTTITVNGTAYAGNGMAFYSLSFFFGSATGTTTSYTGVSLVESV